VLNKRVYHLSPRSCCDYRLFSHLTLQSILIRRSLILHTAQPARLDSSNGHSCDRYAIQELTIQVEKSLIFPNTMTPGMSEATRSD
jgi:hypothetical protein